MMLCRLLEDLDCTLVQGRSDIEVNAICCDSRSVTPGCVFVWPARAAHRRPTLCQRGRGGRGGGSGV